MSEVVIVAAGRSPIGRRGGALSGLHPASLLAQVQRAVVERAGIDPGQIGQVVGGCVTQTGEQAVNVTRTAWLHAGLPLEVAASTVDAQCGSSQHAMSLAVGLIRSQTMDVAMACGVEAMSRIPIGSTAGNEWGHPAPPAFEDHYRWTTQFDGAEMIVDRWGLSRDDTDGFGLRSQQKAAEAWAANRFDEQIVAIEAPVLDAERRPTGELRTVTRDEGLRDTTLEGLARLKPVTDGGVHTAGTSSQISDGASAVVLASAEAARRLGLTPLARVVDHCLVGSDPELMLTGPIPATRRLLERHGLGIDDIDHVEINEAFASVVLAWAAELAPSDFDRVNPDGGAIALGHPLGGTGTGLVTKAVYGLRGGGGSRALVTMCCGGGLGTGTLLEAL
jgi:acetyl-CoA C-acetyltransferase